MSERKVRPTIWFWIISLILLLWNILGLMMFIHQMTMSPTEMAELSQIEQNFLINRPLWVVVSFGIAVFTGVLGCLALLLKNMLAKPLLLVSLIAVIVQMSHMLFLINAMEILEEGSAFMTISVLIVSIFLVIFSNISIKKGWLK
ncbi:MAG: hypothetical protein ACI8XB_000937 [Patiriisocius sp.]|jgi:hypothetical protein